ncbi:hypothetical protein ACFWC9_00310 [Streptomyces goshikiensis]|uniref:hypothetical protein n=1 Tax=Streptomyces goshikiensis TaxID=1942 RepID=UPI0036923A64
MRSTRRTHRRTTFRTAAVLAGAAAVLAVPVGSAFADSSAGAAAPVTVRLADGSVAKVYKTGPNRFEADIFAGSTKLDTLVSGGGGVAYGRSDGLHVVLQPNGGVTSWMEGGEKPRPQARSQAKGVASVRVAMPDGRIAKLVTGAGGERAVISLPNGEVLGAIDLRHPSVLNDGWTYKLVRDGERVRLVVIDGRGGGGNSWVYDFGSGKPVGPKPGPGVPR